MRQKNKIHFERFHGSLLLLCLMANSCSEIRSLNFQKHIFKNTAKKIIWLQVPGLALEHIGLLRFENQKVEKLTSFEKASCLGYMWNYNFFKIRPSPSEGLLTQVVGSPNIDGSCDDYKQRPIWNDIALYDFRSDIIHKTSSEIKGFDAGPACEKKSKAFYKNSSIYVMAYPYKKGTHKFNIQSLGEIPVGQVSYDTSCDEKECYHTQLYYAQKLWKTYSNKQKYLLIIRNDRYDGYLQKKQIVRAKNELREIEEIYHVFYEIAQQNRDVLLLLSSTSPRMFEFPGQGQEWKTFHTKGRPIFWHLTSPMSPVLAKGAGAENFCGIYEEATLKKRINLSISQ